jgi:hypothetical protein
MPRTREPKGERNRRRFASARFANLAANEEENQERVPKARGAHGSSICLADWVAAFEKGLQCGKPLSRLSHEDAPQDGLENR